MNGMDKLKGKNVLMVGIARSGISTLKALKSVGSNVTISDLKSEEDFGGLIGELKRDGLFSGSMLGKHPDGLERFDMIVMSPGVPTDLPFVEKARSLGIDVIGELELAYEINSRPHYIGITGTNGKTTTTSLTGEIFKRWGKDVRIVGNIGLPVVSQVFDSDENTYMITEISSFQLETIKSFNVEIGAILNITPDHLNRHKTMGNYIGAKERLFENTRSDQFAIFNGDDELTSSMAGRVNARCYEFSRKVDVRNGVYVKEGALWFADGPQDHEMIISTGEILMPGQHNIENAMAASLIAILSGVPLNVIADTLRSFKGVEHRIEFVGELDGVRYFNDSKATNTDAAIKAIEAMSGRTVLIAGGMDKGSTFDEFIDAFEGRVSHLVLYGETKEKIRKSAVSRGFTSVTVVNDLKEAMEAARSLSSGSENVLLSPACASWDMYENFEARGDHFKSIFNELKSKG